MLGSPEGSATGQRFAGAKARLYRKIVAAVQIGNAACILEAHSRRLEINTNILYYCTVFYNLYLF